MIQKIVKIVILLLALNVTSCVTTNTVTGDGQWETKKLVVTNYRGVLISDVDEGFPITIQQGSPSVAVSGEKNIITYFSVDTTDGILRFYKNDSLNFIVDSLNFVITVPFVDTITIEKGNIDFNCLPSIESSITLKGNATLSTHLEAKNVMIRVEDSASITVDGVSTNLAFYQTSTAKQHLDSLFVDNFYLDCNSENPPQIYAIDRIRGMFNSPNNLILLYKTPLVDVTRKGNGYVVYKSDTTKIVNE